MAEQELNPKTKVKSIPFEKIVKVEVSGFFYARLSQLLTNFVADNQIELLPALEELKKRDPKSTKEYDLITLVSLCTAIEEAAKKQELIEEHTVEELQAKAEARKESGDDPES